MIGIMRTQVILFKNFQKFDAMRTFLLSAHYKLSFSLSGMTGD